MPISPYVAGLRRKIGHELLMLPGVSAAVFNDAGEVLLARRSDNGQWSVPAGSVDPGEQPADAIVREVYEETGVQAYVERIVGVALHPVTYPNGDQCQYLSVWFHCTAVGGEARVNDDESTAVGWFAVDALPEVGPLVRLRVEMALKGEVRAWFARPGANHAALGSPDPPGPAPTRAGA
jgi:8-oxo-dGTP diphosphatase